MGDVGGKMRKGEVVEEERGRREEGRGRGGGGVGRR